ncbi:BTB/POZ domain-containing protein KCTD9 [Anopheles arabiensis]|uniref:BTB domain-containing protein n=1 Tax=Anopheles arabiensis TaxID=7173 RepID=A0A182HGP5_ANOAR|nr:BTB/POZ domain-containing protein KCTD9 [Anopheles arabiensis]
MEPPNGTVSPAEPAADSDPVEPIRTAPEPDGRAERWVTLNVGGEIFTTTRLTLTNREPNSMIARMFAQDQLKPAEQDGQGAYLIDRNGHYFRPILDYLRHGRVIYDRHVSLQGILEEARYYGLDGLARLIQEIERADVSLTRLDFIRTLVTSSHTTELRFQGVHLSGINLSKLDLRNINFKYACLSHCNLSYANLSWCCLERAELRCANLEGAKLHSVMAACADLQGAKLKCCDLTRCSLENANMKGATLEGSVMEGVSLRVANLKSANMRNCTLNDADMAGANLESCDLTGCNLKGANLRGANLKGAQLEKLVTPVHMSQIDI